MDFGQILGDHPPQRILVFRALQLGDMLCAVPTMRALRHAFPGANVTLCSLPWARSFARRFDRYIDDFLAFPGWPGLAEREYEPAKVAQWLRRVQRERYDLAIQLQGSGEHANEMLALCGARANAGLRRAGQFAPPGAFAEYRPAGHEIERLLAVATSLGIETRGTYLEFPLGEEDWCDLGTVAPQRDAIARPYVVLHPGARFYTRRWPAERFAAVGDELRGRGFDVYLTGSIEETDIAARVLEWMRYPAFDLSGRTSLGAAAALVSEARLVVTNDTGMSHIAAAVGTPSVVAVLGSEVSRWAPLDRRRHRPVLAAAECRPCMHRQCPIDFRCAVDLTVDRVLEACGSILMDRLAEAPERLLSAAARIAGGTPDINSLQPALESA